MLSLKLQSCVKLMETADYSFVELMGVINWPQNNREFSLRDASTDPDFWLLIDSIYCESQLTLWRFDVLPERRRYFVEGFLAKRVFIYTVKHDWDLQIPTLTVSDDIIIGERNITYPQVADALHKRTMDPTVNKNNFQYVPIQLVNLEATQGSYGYAWEFSYQFYRVYYPDKLPRRTCLFKSKEDSLDYYNRMIDNLSAHIHYICHDGLDFDVPPHNLGFLIDGEDLIPSKLGLIDIREHLLQVFNNERTIDLTKFSSDGTLHCNGYILEVYNIYDDGENVGIEFQIDVSQLKF
jgi:hypothetical protein